MTSNNYCAFRYFLFLKKSTCLLDVYMEIFTGKISKFLGLASKSYCQKKSYCSGGTGWGGDNRLAMSENY